MVCERVCHIQGPQRVVDLVAVKRGHRIMCFGAVAAFGQALETELRSLQSTGQKLVNIRCGNA